MIGRLATGHHVIEKGSHIHQGTERYLQVALKHLGMPDKTPERFVKQTIDFGEVIGMATCVPVTSSDVVFFARRPGRQGLSKFSFGATCRKTTLLTVVVKRVYGTDYYRLLTAYFGEAAPVEPFSPIAQKSSAAREESLAFWNTHALVPELPSQYGEPFELDTVTNRVPEGWQ
ncbi:MAG TPA: hypothetical protein VD907_01475 [Verrucomicrobiae bacterium]|nr:hypothetical protein [Verrucomicrobiae bacterium]